MNKKTVKKGLLPYVFLLIVILGVVYFFNIANKKVNVITYDEFVKFAEEGVIKDINITPNSRAGLYTITGTNNNYAGAFSGSGKGVLANIYHGEEN